MLNLLSKIALKGKNTESNLQADVIEQQMLNEEEI